ncbi:MAG: efflux RND transporter permease subunit [Dehalococcoidia bacterium]|nr:MAG: efflux RND transporter permease subunit [Dehalococcoidia bacterium]
MWYLTKLSMKSRFITIFLAALLAGASIWATFQLKLEMIPDIELPFSFVITAYPNASPEQVNDDVTVHIENAVWDRWEGNGLKYLEATSADGISVVVAEFEYGTDMKQVHETIREDIGDLELPPDLVGVPGMEEGNPRVVDVDFGEMMPLVQLSLVGEVPTAHLRDVATNTVAPLLEDVNGVFEVPLEGGEAEKTIVGPDPVELRQSGVSMFQIAALLSMNPEYDSLDNVVNLPMMVDSIVLGNVAGVDTGPAPRTSITRTNGEPSIGIVVMKEADANVVDVANAVVEKVAEINETLEEGLELVVVFDQSEFIEESISELTQMALIGAALAIIVVFIFLAAFRASLVTSMSIPFSIIVGFLAMYFTNITVNLLTLSAMAIAVGRLIDNSIVVAEVVYRRMKNGEGFMEASIGGSKEVAGPITSSTLATVAIFLPLMFVGGIVGELFIPFALTITYALIASLLIALIVVPAFSKWFVGSRKKDSKVSAGDTWYQKLYIPSLKWALGHRVLTLVIAGVLFIGSLGLLQVIGSSFLPGMFQPMLVVEIEMPPGTDIATTGETAAMVEVPIGNLEGVELYYTMIGASSSTTHGAVTTAMGGGDNTGEIMILLDDDADQEKLRDELEDAVEDMMLGDYVKVMTGEEMQSSRMGSSGIELSVRGDNYDDINTATTLLAQRLEGIDGLNDLEYQVTQVVPKLNIILDYNKMDDLGLSEEEIGKLEQERLLLEMGGPLSDVEVNVDGETYGLFINGVARDIYVSENPEDLAKALPVGFPSVVTLGDVADVSFAEGLTHISHSDLRLSAAVTGSITEKDVGAVTRQVNDEIKEVEKELDALGIQGVEIAESGIGREMAESFSSMGMAILAAIVIAYLILVVTMRSILNPLIIMVSLPLATIGAFLGLLITGYTLDMSGMMGMLMLVGIVLTNAIVLIALVEQLRKEGINTYDALIEAGRTRLRPILMTALTTMVAMVPIVLGVGEGTIIAAELAVVVIGGLFSSTLLTLLVIPVIYSLVDGLRQRVKNRRAA